MSGAFEVDVLIICRVPSRYADAAAHGGKCNWSVRCPDMAKARAALQLHQTVEHPDTTEATS